MSLSTAQGTITGTAAKISGTALADPDTDRKVRFAVTASADCYLGPAGVTTGTGFLLKAGNIFTIDLGYGEDLYIVGTSGTYYTTRSSV